MTSMLSGIAEAEIHGPIRVVRSGAGPLKSSDMLALYK